MNQGMRETRSEAAGGVDIRKPVFRGLRPTYLRVALVVVVVVVVVVVIFTFVVDV